MSPTLSVLSRRIGTVSEEAEFPSAGQRVKISQSIRVRLPAAAETSRESIWFFSEKNKLCRAYFKKNNLPSWDSVVWMTLCRPLEAVIDLETCAYLLKLSGNTCTHSPGFEFWRWVTLIRQERLVEMMGLLSSEMLYSDPKQRGFLSVIMWNLGWSRYFLWRAVQLPPGGPGCWLRPLTTTSWSCFFVTYQTPVRPNKAPALARS